MSIENKTTVKVYQKYADKYLITNAEHTKLYPERVKTKIMKEKEIIKDSFSSLPSNSKIFEIGSGEGIYAKFLQDLGYDVTGSDISNAFINATQNQGVKTIKFNVIEDKFPEKYNGILCWKVFVHFTEKDVLNTLKKVYDCLEKDGIFIFNTMNRETKSVNEEWVDFSNEYHLGVERYFHYYLKEEIDEMISKTNFYIQTFYKEGGDNRNKWLVYVLKK